MSPLSPSRRIVTRDNDALAAMGWTSRSIRRAQDEGRLSRIKPSGRTGPCLVDFDEAEEYMALSTEPPTRGPLAGQGGDLDALTRRWAEDRDPEAQAALIAIVQKADSALWGDA